MTYTVNTKASWQQTMSDLSDEMRLWNIDDWGTNMPRGANWQSWKPQSELERTVKLSYTKNGKQVNLEMGKQSRAVDNLRVLYLAVHDMRLNEVRGLSEIMESAYLQIAGGVKKNPYETLQIMKDAPLEVAEASYKARARFAHPDNGGSTDQMMELNEAIEAIRADKAI